MSEELERLRVSVWQGVWLPAGLGILAGLAVVMDPWIRARLQALGEGWLPRLYPCVGTAAVSLAGLAAAGLWARRDFLFGRRDRALLTALFVPLLFTGFNLGGLDPTDVAIVAVLYVWLLTVLVERRPLVLPRSYLLLLLLLAFFSLASVVNGLLPAVLKQHTMISKLVLFVLVVNMVRTRADLERACRLVVSLGVVAAILALAQVLTFALTGVPITLVDLSEVMFKGPLLRASALFPTTQVLAHFLSFATALNLFVTRGATRRAAATLLMGAAVALTWSVGAWLVWGLVLLAWPVVARPNLALRYAAAVCLVVAVSLPAVGAAGLDIEWLRGVGQNSASDRVALLQGGIEMIRRHPILGCGLASHGRLTSVPVHNAYIQMASEIGVAGALVYCALVALVIWRALMVAAAGRESGSALARALFLGTSAMAVHFMTEPFANNVISWAFLGLAAGAPLTLQRADDTPEPAEER